MISSNFFYWNKIEELFLKRQIAGIKLETRECVYCRAMVNEFVPQITLLYSTPPCAKFNK